MRNHNINNKHILLTVIFSLLFITKVSIAANNSASTTTQQSLITPITSYLLSDDNVCTVDGNWLVKLDWYCDGNYDYGNVTFKSDGTFIASDNQSQYKGTWNESNKSITWNFDNHLVSYHGTVNTACSAMAGSMRASNGATGCWSATRQNAIKNNTLLADQNPWFPVVE